MNKEDYFKYYIQGSDHNLIPKDVFNELFDEMSNWREEVKELNQKYLNAVADYETTMFEKEQLNSLVNSCQEEIRRLNKQLEYLRSGEYYNQLRFENEMLQQVVDTNGVPSEVYDYIDCTHRNTELLMENQELKKQVEEYKEQVNKGLYNVCLPYQTGYNKAIKDKENQQKEFIKYLEDKIYSIEPKGTGINYNCEYDSEEDYISAMQEQSRLNTLKEILQKYRSIIGVSDENNKQ